jgi:hypothetical protein
MEGRSKMAIYTQWIALINGKGTVPKGKQVITEPKMRKKAHFIGKSVCNE